MKSILVPIGGSDTDLSVFETALLVARLFSSHLQFLHIQIGAGEAARMFRIPSSRWAPLYRMRSKSWIKTPPPGRQLQSDIFVNIVHDHL